MIPVHASPRSLLLSLLTFALLPGGAGAGAASPPRNDAPVAVVDAWLDGRLESALALNPYLRAFELDTRVDEGIAVISGTVSSEVERWLAVEIARAVDGISRVSSELEVDPSLAQPATESASLGENEHSFFQRVEDATATARIRRNLMANGNTKNLAVEVNTRGNVVTLSGRVPSRKEKMLVEMIARNTEGIASVNNRIEIDDERA